MIIIPYITLSICGKLVQLIFMDPFKMISLYIHNNSIEGEQLELSQIHGATLTNKPTSCACEKKITV